MRASSLSSVDSRGSTAVERQLFAWLSVAILGMVLVGFSRTYLMVPVLGMPEDTPPYSSLIHGHAAVFFSWCVFYVLQSWLVARNRIRVHRRLGQFGLLLYAGMVTTGIMVGLHSVMRYGATPDELSFLSVSLGNVLAFSIMIGAAFLWRKHPAAHKRLMAVGMVPLLSAPFGRLAEWPYMLQHVIGPGMVVVALAVIDLRIQHKVHPVTKYAGVAVLAWELLPNLYMHSAVWLGVASWLVKVAA
ncbi:MAG TPA: hypothetical protein PLR28_00080 [Dokdonella sp.]|uniref:hypothetical protein n=1 Tax=Dokdonella sp. TaxID=2291710 RepID=UPI002CC23709|nr:hypothetical protein [Dokdonella sp.]HOX70808.1 hypothetical protein [Dokdonella sp.]HPG92931.1 hypothetical protein [Dokdonella sp.]HPN78167.1 hypothetical protein [Dokdonella sp.]